jgi:chromosome segregation protein
VFLKSLSIKGFKSFADATTLVMEPGVTVVVGPNGSGKSNVVDAIGGCSARRPPARCGPRRWTTSSSPGRQKRPALGRAEVSLTIDNSAGALPIEFTEVTITRTLFRTGDSEYAINGVQLPAARHPRAAQRLGCGAPAARDHQPGPDRRSAQRPARRPALIIEEAAGVLKFRRRKEKASGDWSTPKAT